ncbi:MAG: DUF1127 domain-containing protein [Pseudaminobacter sp.]|nr:DUF1127 domain-containing protein [Pseudaminobacter sp.]
MSDDLSRTAARPEAEASVYRGLGHCLRRAIGRIDDWVERRRQRHILAELTDGQLRDIGLSRDEAFREARKPFWRP